MDNQRKSIPFFFVPLFASATLCLISGPEGTSLAYLSGDIDLTMPPDEFICYMKQIFCSLKCNVRY